MGEAFYITLMEIFMRENGSTTRQMEEVHIPIQTEQSMWANGRKTNKMVLVWSNGWMENAMKANTEMAQKQAKEFSSSLTLATTKVNS